MSKKNAKEPQGVKGVVPIGAVKIIIMSDGSVNVNGFPTDLHVALAWMNTATRAVINFFIDKAKRGELDSNGKVEEKKILTRDKNLVGPDGKILQ